MIEKNIKSRILFLAIICFVLFGRADSSEAATLYADNTLSADCAGGNYSIANRNCGGTDGKAYTSVQTAINAMSAGDKIYLRGGTYREGYILIPAEKNGNSWEDGHYNLLASYPGEWAILDGQRSAEHGVVIGNYDYGDGHQLKYWMLERLEITGGGSTAGSGTSNCGGFWGNGGPFKIRYNYIHDNLSYTYENNPGGLTGAEWKDSTVEYNYFKNNGSDGAVSHNCAHINLYSDYLNAANAEFGYGGIRGTRNNAYRYNYFEDGYVGIKHKAGQLLSGRNAAGGHGWDDTYIEQGDKIHHNIFRNTEGTAIFESQDFGQVFNNIIDTRNVGISVQYEPVREGHYKVGTYNNSFINPSGPAINRYGKKFWPFEETEYYGFDLNNLIIGGNSSIPWGQARIINVIPYNAGGEPFGYSNYTASHNYFYRPLTTDLFRFYQTDYTSSGFESQTATHSPRSVYLNSGGEALNFSYANRYAIDGNHVMEGSATIANGGIGGSNPYISGVTIPSYVGAVNPDDNAWVGGVLGLATISNLRSGGANDPDWIEGGGGSSSDTTAPASPTGLAIN